MHEENRQNFDRANPESEITTVTPSEGLYEPGEIVVSTREIERIVGRLGREISVDYNGRNPVLVNLLKGGVVFLADLIRQISVPHQIDFLGVSSYENGTNSSGSVRIVEDLSTNVAGRDVLIVEDVLDTGRTLAYILDMLEIRSPESIEVCALLKKESPSQAGIDVKYLGKVIPDIFVVGYGLDFDEDYRHLPYVAKLSIPD
jgi:hypoxanthine phosphoribosyltransferase